MCVCLFVCVCVCVCVFVFVEVEPGQFWMLWSDFMQFFSEITICKVGVMNKWSQPFHFDGVYSREQPYGPQCNLCVVGDGESQVLISIAKEDLRL
jgi:hypothetical protein